MKRIFKWFRNRRAKFVHSSSEYLNVSEFLSLEDSDFSIGWWLGPLKKGSVMEQLFRRDH